MLAGSGRAHPALKWPTQCEQLGRLINCRRVRARVRAVLVPSHSRFSTSTQGQFPSQCPPADREEVLFQRWHLCPLNHCPDLGLCFPRLPQPGRPLINSCHLLPLQIGPRFTSLPTCTECSSLTMLFMFTRPTGDKCISCISLKRVTSAV